MLRKCVCLCFIFVLLLLYAAPFAFAEDVPTTEIRVVKRWQDTQSQSRPESVGIELYADGELAGTINLSGNDSVSSWFGSFLSMPVYKGERSIVYTVRELNVTGYDVHVSQQPLTEAVTLSSWGEKITPASESSYSIGSRNLLLAKKGGEYFVWSRLPLSARQQEQLIYLVNLANLQGIGKKLSFDNTLFRSGLPAVFENNGVSINGSAGDVTVEFAQTSDWSLFYTGLLGLREAQEAIIENRLIPTATPSPLPTATPEITPEPSPLPVITFSITKQWHDRDASLRPESAQAEIYRDRQLWETVILSEENSWSYSWQAQDNGSLWAVKEIRIPEGYKSSVSRVENSFIITNTSTEFPATGDVSKFEFYAVCAALCLMGLTVLVALPLLVHAGKRK